EGLLIGRSGGPATTTWMAGTSPGHDIRVRRSESLIDDSGYGITARAVGISGPCRLSTAGTHMQEERYPLPAAAGCGTDGMIRDGWLAQGLDEQTRLL